MPPKTLIFGVVIIIIVLAIGAFGFSQLNNSPNQSSQSPSQSSSPIATSTVTSTPAPTPSPTPVPQTVEEIRDSALYCLNSSHREVAAILNNLIWTGGKVETGLVGSATYAYYSGTWNMTIQYPIVDNPTYNITANYTRGIMIITWVATYQSGTFTQVNYGTEYGTVVTTEEQVRDAAVTYIATNHNETAPYMTTFSWSGGLQETGFVGSALYMYQKEGWTVTIQYPIVENPVYNVNATYVSPTTQSTIINWQGLWENGAVVENAYAFTP